MIQNNYIANYVAIVHYSIITRRMYCRILHTNIGERLTSILYKQGYFLMYRIIPQGTISYIYIQLKHARAFMPLLSIKLVSKPTNLIYWTIDRLLEETARGGALTQYMLSTSKGLLLSSNAISLGVGGKVLFRIN